MFILTEYLRGIAIIHVMWLFFFVIGTLLRTPKFGTALTVDRNRHRPEALLEIVVSSIAGMTITGFVTFALGMAGLIYPGVLVLLLVAVGFLFTALGDSPLRKSFWSRRVELARSAQSRPALFIYIGALILAIPAVLPETAFDPLFSYHVYAIDWASAHRIYVDEWRRIPNYPFNWILLNTWLVELRLNRYFDFLTWLTSCLSLLGVYAYVVVAGTQRGERTARYAKMAGILATLSVCAAPVFLRWNDTGMFDVPLGMLFLAAMASAHMAFMTRRRDWLLNLIVCIAFLAGMKVSVVAFVPMALLLVWFLARRSGSSRKGAAVAALVCLILSAPWYVKTFLETGESFYPTLTLLLHGTDSKWSRADMAGVLADLDVDQTPTARLRLPLDIFVHPETMSFREPGVTLMLSLVVLPGFATMFGLLQGSSRTRSALFLDGALLLYAVAYWLLTSHLARYALLFYPALAAYVALILLELAGTSKRRLRIALVSLAILVIPSPNSPSFYSQFWENDFWDIAHVYTGPKSYLASHVGAYLEEEFISHVMIKAGDQQTHVYGVLVNDLNYYFKLHGITEIGDWFGPQRYSDLATAIDHGTAPKFFSRFNVTAVLLNAPSGITFLSASQIRELERQLAHARYKELTLSGRPYRFFLAPALQCCYTRTGTTSASLLTHVSAPQSTSLPEPHNSERGSQVFGVPRYSFTTHYDDGSINSDAKVQTPTGRGALILPAIFKDKPVKALTVLATFRYSYRTQILAGDVLAFEAAKLPTIGIATFAFVDVNDGRKSYRVFGADLPPADAASPRWRSFRFRLDRFRGKTVTFTFGTDAVDGNATAAWSSFVNAGIYRSANLRAKVAPTF